MAPFPNPLPGEIILHVVTRLLLLLYYKFKFGPLNCYKLGPAELTSVYNKSFILSRDSTSDEQEAISAG